MRAERFVTEYGNYKKQGYAECYRRFGNSAMLEYMEKVDKLILMRELGYITADEAIACIGKIGKEESA